MNLIIHVTLAIVFAIHSADSSVQPVRADYSNPSALTHRVARRASLPYWLRELRNGGRFNSAGFLRKNRHTEDIFTEDDAAVDVALEPYIQQAPNTGKVIAPNAEDAMIFGAGGANADKVIVSQAGAMEGAAAIDFGVQDRLKNRFPHHERRPGCNKTEGVVDASGSDASEVADVSSSLDFINQPVWTPVVNESQCQSYGSSQFCEDVTNYPAEAIKEILMSDNGSLLTTFFADNIQPLASSSQPDESMILAQRKPDLSTAVTSHAINTRIKPVTSTTDILPLCDSKTEFLFPKSARSKDNEMLMIVNQDNISQPITVETCRGENKPCHHAENFPAGFKAVCMQKFVTHHLAAIKNGKIVREAFTFPSCCVCVLKQPFLDSRANIPSGISRRAIMPSAQQRMAAEIDGQRWQ